MTQSRKQGCYWLGLVVLLGLFEAIASASTAALAQQVVPDATLPLNSTVTSVGNNFTITGGTQVGSNLFHSFSQFSVPTNGQAFFNNSLSVQNIISRVTGLSPSNIDGILRANGTANLFLLNPNGIIFGPNASLNVGGSFVGTTANAIQFGTQGFFSASVPNAPSPLLTVNPSALLFNQIAAASIQNNSVASLSVPDGQSLLLVGGDINMNGGRLNAFGGRVELGGLAGTGTVGLQVNSNNLSLSFPDGVARGDVSLTNGAIVDVHAENGGSIALNARTLELVGGSGLQAGMASGMGSAQSQAGNIEVNALAAVNLDGGFIANTVPSGATGKAGDIKVTTGSLSLINAAQLYASSFGQGNAGNITITARDGISFDRGGAVFSKVESGATGNGGDVSINTGSLSLANDAQLSTSNRGRQGDAGNISINTGTLSLTNAELSTSTSGRGNAGNITITARDGISLNGAAALSNLESPAVGKGGNISINTGTMSVINAARLDTSSFGQGNAGNITITARDGISFDHGGAVFSRVESGAIGNGGDVSINTGSLSLANDAQLSTSNRGQQGNAGNITITARDQIFLNGSAAFSSLESPAVGKGGNISINTGTLSLTNTAQLYASSFGQGNAGNITIMARDGISFDHGGAVFSRVESGAIGNGGDVSINTGSLSLANDAQLSTSTSGRGNAGNITITARDGIFLNGSAAFSSLQSPGVGKGGNISINTSSLSLINAAQLYASSFGQGNAGNITITARDGISFDRGGAVFSKVESGAMGNGGDVSINTGSLSLANAAQLSTSSFARGDAGNISITARDGIFLNGSAAFSSLESPAVGKGGNISINTGTLSLTNAAQLYASSFGQGNAGNITITARDGISFDRGGAVFSRVESGATGNGGDVSINTSSLSLNDAQLNANSLGQGTAGNIEVRSRSINLDNKATLTATSSLGQGGDINLIVQDLLLLRRGSEITTTAGTPGTRGDGGKITIDASSGFIVAVPEEDSHIRANAFKGKGGTVNIKTSGVFGFQISPPPDTLLSDITASSDQGPQGIVTINTPDVDPSRGVFVLPVQVVDPSQKIASGCPAGDGTTGNSFTVTGRGGLPPSPDEPLSSDVVWSDTRLTNISNGENLRVSVPIRSHPKALEIVPATGWVFNGKGEVTLIAHSPSTFYPSDSRASTCNGK